MKRYIIFCVPICRKFSGRQVQTPMCVVPLFVLYFLILQLAVVVLFSMSSFLFLFFLFCIIIFSFFGSGAVQFNIVVTCFVSFCFYLFLNFCDFYFCLMLIFSLLSCCFFMLSEMPDTSIKYLTILSYTFVFRNNIPKASITFHCWLTCGQRCRVMGREVSSIFTALPQKCYLCRTILLGFSIFLE